MKWRKSDIEKYVQAKEYIDTALIPLLPFNLANDEEAKKSSFQSELLTIIVSEIEKEITGRILLLPNFYYVKDSDRNAETQRLQSWTSEAGRQGLENIFYITFDSAWKKSEKQLDGNLIWLPAIQSGDIQSKEMEPVIRDQKSQMVELIRSYWQ
jgi:hypothetical protein